MNEIYLIEKDSEGKPIIGRKLNLAGFLGNTDGGGVSTKKNLRSGLKKTT